MIGYKVMCQNVCLSCNRGYKDRSEALGQANKDVKYIRNNHKEYDEYDLIISIFDEEKIL